MVITRRNFVGSALAAGVWEAAAGTAAPHMESRHLGGVGHDKRVPPLLKFGVVSDVHVRLAADGRRDRARDAA